MKDGVVPEMRDADMEKPGWFSPPALFLMKKLIKLLGQFLRVTIRRILKVPFKGLN